NTPDVTALSALETSGAKRPDMLHVFEQRKLNPDLKTTSRADQFIRTSCNSQTQSGSTFALYCEVWNI
ncbi:MAG TPA: hypothetical protein VE843_11200, partial [Ktedonobacteraceae bacterium]|nr:hypothetical protein [Ktedonobacteraceae bacterium]